MSDGASEMLRDEPEPNRPIAIPRTALLPDPHHLEQFFRCGALDLFVRQGLKPADIDSLRKILDSLRETL